MLMNLWKISTLNKISQRKKLILGKIILIIYLFQDKEMSQNPGKEMYQNLGKKMYQNLGQKSLKVKEGHLRVHLYLFYLKKIISFKMFF